MKPAQTPRVHPSLLGPGSFLFPETLLGAGAQRDPFVPPERSWACPRAMAAQPALTSPWYGSTAGVCRGCPESSGVSWGCPSRPAQAVVPQLLTLLPAQHGVARQAQARLQGVHELPAPQHTACAKPPAPGPVGVHAHVAPGQVLPQRLFLEDARGAWSRSSSSQGAPGGWGARTLQGGFSWPRDALLVLGGHLVEAVPVALSQGT